MTCFGTKDTVKMGCFEKKVGCSETEMFKPGYDTVKLVAPHSLTAANLNGILLHQNNQKNLNSKKLTHAFQGNMV